MRVAHATVFPQGQTFASSLKFRNADFLAFARLQTLGSTFVCGSHGAVALDVFLDFLLGVLSHGHGREQSGGEDQERFFHEMDLEFKS